MQPRWWLATPDEQLAAFTLKQPKVQSMQWC